MKRLGNGQEREESKDMKCTRRDFLGILASGAGALAFGGAVHQGLARPCPNPGAGALVFGGAVHAQALRKPNVLIIFTDDQGTLDVGCYGSADLETPSLDALAKRGTRFTQFYGGSAVCSPSRAALLTGRFPHRAGVPGNAESHPTDFGKGHGLKDEQVTIAEMLKAAGYRTGHFGKWHLGFKPGPNAQGFDESVGFMGGCIDKWSHFNYGKESWGRAPKRHDWYRNGEEAWESGTHSGDIIVREVNAFMAADPAHPFFVYAAFGIPHYPLQPYDKWREHYKDVPEPRRAYAAFVSTVDEQIGRILGQAR